MRPPLSSSSLLSSSLRSKVLLSSLVLCASCAGAPPRVDLDAGWPRAAPDYRAAQERWTRRGGYSEDWMRIIDAAATLESPEWRAAYARERARRQRLGSEAEAALADAQRAAAEGVWEVELVVATAKPEWNDLRKGKDSMWRLALATDDGREVTATSVREDRRPRGEIAAYFPDLKPFYSPYLVTFPKVLPDGRPLISPATKQVTLKIASALGAVELVWRE